MRSSLHVLLVGGGHASVALLPRAAAWVRAGHTVTLVSDHPSLYYSGMVPERTGGVYADADVRIDLERWCRTQGLGWHRARVTAVDPARRAVAAEDGRAWRCDVAVFDVGARNPLAGAAARDVPTKPLHRIARLAAFLDAAARRPEHPKRLVVVGGGAAGVEIALNVSARFEGTALRLDVVEPASRLLTEFPAGAGRYAARLLRRRGVALHVGCRASAGEDGVTLDDGTALPADAVVWATGSTAPALFADAGLPCDDRGFVRVDAALRSPAAPWLFAAGDAAVVEGHEDLARVGVHAVKQGPVLRDNVERMLRHLADGGAPATAPLRTFRPYPVAPLILSTGTPEGLFVAGRVWGHGRAALRLKHAVDLRWMDRYRHGPRTPWAERLHGRHAGGTRAPTTRRAPPVRGDGSCGLRPGRAPG